MEILKGKWVVDPSHSSVTFSVKHLMISKVKGSFGAFEGVAVTDGVDVLNTKLEATVTTESVDTKDKGRDAHLRGEDFFDVEKFPVMSFKSEQIESTKKEDVFIVHGQLTIKDVTKPVDVTVELGGVGVDPYNNTKAAAEAVFVIDRTEFGLTWNAALEAGGVLVGNDITVTVDVQATLEK